VVTAIESHATLLQAWYSGSHAGSSGAAALGGDLPSVHDLLAAFKAVADSAQHGAQPLQFQLPFDAAQATARGDAGAGEGGAGHIRSGRLVRNAPTPASAPTSATHSGNSSGGPDSGSANASVASARLRCLLLCATRLLACPTSHPAGWFDPDAPFAVQLSQHQRTTQQQADGGVATIPSPGAPAAPAAECVSLPLALLLSCAASFCNPVQVARRTGLPLVESNALAMHALRLMCAVAEASGPSRLMSFRTLFGRVLTDLLAPAGAGTGDALRAPVPISLSLLACQCLLMQQLQITGGGVAGGPSDAASLSPVVALAVTKCIQALLLYAVGGTDGGMSSLAARAGRVSVSAAEAAECCSLLSALVHAGYWLISDALRLAVERTAIALASGAGLAGETARRGAFASKTRGTLGYCDLSHASSVGGAGVAGSDADGNLAFTPLSAEEMSAKPTQRRKRYFATKQGQAAAIVQDPSLPPGEPETKRRRLAEGRTGDAESSEGDNDDEDADAEADESVAQQAREHDRSDLLFRSNTFLTGASAVQPSVALRAPGCSLPLRGTGVQRLLHPAAVARALVSLLAACCASPWGASAFLSPLGHELRSAAASLPFSGGRRAAMTPFAATASEFGASGFAPSAYSLVMAMQPFSPFGAGRDAHGSGTFASLRAAAMPASTVSSAMVKTAESAKEYRMAVAPPVAPIAPEIRTHAAPALDGKKQSMHAVATVADPVPSHVFTLSTTIPSAVVHSGSTASSTYEASTSNAKTSAVNDMEDDEFPDIVM
jgi:hypothetical protein